MCAGSILYKMSGNAQSCLARTRSELWRDPRCRVRLLKLHGHQQLERLAFDLRRRLGQWLSAQR